MIYKLREAVNYLRIVHKREQYKSIITPMANRYIKWKIEAYEEVLEIINEIIKLDESKPQERDNIKKHNKEEER